MLVGLGVMVAVASASLAEVRFFGQAQSVAPLSGESVLMSRRTARALARASRAAESAGDLPAALDLARESYVLRPSRRALQRIDGLARRVKVARPLGRR